MRRIVFAGLVATGLFAEAVAPHIATAQPAPLAQAPVFDAAAKHQAIATAAKLLTDKYVYADVGARAAAMLTQNLAAGKYDAIATPAAFADQLTKDLQAVAHDKHLRVFADGVRPDDAPAGPPPPIGLYGFAQADRLKGNIGYIVLNGFLPKLLSKQGADKAMALVATTDALIIDIRNNHGGDPAAVSYLVSFFFDGKTPVHVNDLLWRKPGTTDYDRKTFSTEPTAVSYLNKPVYLITGPGTFSGGEEFAYDMQTLKRATLVGAVTGGGANPGGDAPIGPGLSLFVPGGRAENPITHTSWEGKGVQPDVAVPLDQAFSAAYAAALHSIGHPAPPAAEKAEAATEAHLLVPPRTTPAPGSEAALRRLNAGLADGNPPYDLLSDDMAKITREQLSGLHTLFNQLGAMQSLTFVNVDLMGADIYEAKFAHGSARFIVAMGADGKIVGCMMQPE